MFSLRNDTFLQEDRGCLSESTHSHVHFLCTKDLSCFPLVSLNQYRYTLFMAGKFKAAISRPFVASEIEARHYCFKNNETSYETKDTLPFVNMKGLIRTFIVLDYESYWLLREHPSAKFM